MAAQAQGGQGADAVRRESAFGDGKGERGRWGEAA